MDNGCTSTQPCSTGVISALSLNTDRLNVVLDLAQIGTWNWFVEANQLVWDERAARLWDLETEQQPLSYNRWRQHIHPADLDRVEQALQQTRLTQTAVEVEYRVLHGGEERWLLSRGCVATEAERLPQPTASSPTAPEASPADLQIVGMVMDITSFKRTELMLRDREAVLRSVYEGVDTAIFLVDVSPDGQFRFAGLNPAHERSTGYSNEDICGKTPEELLDAETAAALSANYARCVTEKTSITYEECIPFHHQETWWLTTLTPLQDEQSRVYRIIGNSLNITDRKRAETNIKQSLSLLQTTLESTADGILAINNQGEIVTFNQKFIDLWQLPEVLLSFGDAWQVLPLMQMQLNEPGEFLQDVRLEYSAPETDRYSILKFNDGRVLERYSKVQRLGQTIIGRVISYRDISDRMQAEEQLHLQQQFLRTVIDTNPNLIFVIDRNDRFVLVNQAMADYFDKTVEALTGQFLDCLLLDPEIVREIHASHRKIIQTREPLFIPEFPLHVNGRERWLQWQKQPIYLPERNSYGVLAIGIDITDRQQAEEALRKLNEELELRVNQRTQELAESEERLRHTNEQIAFANEELAQANRLKDEFLANMSHELRTPLNSILGLSEVLLAEVFGKMNEKQRQYLITMQSSGEHLLELINDILDLAKIESGKVDLQISEVAIEPLCDSSLAFVRQQAYRKQIQLSLQIAPPVRAIGTLAVDERRIRQTLINLLSNAVKFTPDSGQVSLEVAVLTQTAVMERVASNSASVWYPLAPIALADRWVLFTVIDTGIGIPITARPKLFQPFVQLDSSLARRYEGTGLGLMLVKQIVELHGGWIEVASEPDQGSQFTVAIPLSRSAESPSPDPDPADGLGAVSSLPLALLSPAPEEANGTESPTIDALLPADWAFPRAAPGLDATVKEDGADPPEPEETSQPPPLILIAEDNPDNCATLSDYLQTQGFRVLLATNGLEAIRTAQAMHPDAILLDVQMPELNGLEAIAYLRSEAATAQIPIIALTALAMTCDRESCLQAGATDYIVKPVRLRQLVQILQTHLNG